MRTIFLLAFFIVVTALVLLAEAYIAAAVFAVLGILCWAAVTLSHHKRDPGQAPGNPGGVSFGSVVVSPFSSNQEFPGQEPSKSIGQFPELSMPSREDPLKRAVAHLKKMEYDRAVTEFTEAIRLDPDNVDVYKARAVAYRALDDEINAASDESKAQEMVKIA